MCLDKEYMSDQVDSNPYSDFAEISFEDISAFIKQQVKNHACPCCTINDWSVIGDDEHFLVLVGMRKNGNFPLPPPTIPAFAIDCKNCGYIRTHSLARVVSWKKAGRQ